MQRRPHFTGLELFLLLVLVVLTGLEIAIYTPPAQHVIHRLGVSVLATQVTGSQTAIRYSVSHGVGDQRLRLLAFPLSTRPVINRSVFVFVDSAYATANTIPTAGQGVFDNLSGDIRSASPGIPVRSVNASELKSVMLDTNHADDRLVALMQGVLPSTVFSLNTDLVSPWVQAGGIVVWGGGTIGYWSATANRSLRSADIIGPGGTDRLLGKAIIAYPSADFRIATKQSDLASGFNVIYTFASSGLLRSSLLSHGGLDLGWDGGPYTSVGFLPRGSGGYLIFGGEIEDEIAVSRDLSVILLLHGTSAQGPTAYQDLALSGDSQATVGTWRVPFAPGHSGLLFGAFDPNPESVMFWSQVIAS
jgi:hypothetical protein